MSFPNPLRLLSVFALACCLLVPAAAQAGGRTASMNTAGKSPAQLSTAGGRTLSRTEVLDFIAERKGRLHGDFGSIRESLSLFDDGSVRGDSTGLTGRSTSGTGSWSVDDDGTLHLRVIWAFGDKLDATGRVVELGNVLYVVNPATPDAPSAYQLRK